MNSSRGGAKQTIAAFKDIVRLEFLSKKPGEVSVKLVERRGMLAGFVKIELRAVCRLIDGFTVYAVTTMVPDPSIDIRGRRVPIGEGGWHRRFVPGPG
jgi:hypothetical protein